VAGFACLLLGFGLFAGALPASAQSSVFLEDLTWPEVRDALRAGKTTVLVPTGGTEQNGPHMVLGKHNIRARHLARAIALKLENALVAPVLPYSPEGQIDPPTGHMWAPGTLTLPPEHFAAVVTYAARSLRAHGFLDIVLIGDSGPNQGPLATVAEALNREWSADAARVHHASAYYEAETAGFAAWLRAEGESHEAIGSHAGLADTSLLLAIEPQAVRSGRLAPGSPGDGTGVSGDPTRASVTYGNRGIELVIDASVRQILELRGSSRDR
jgi:creatinine amidohydrolase